MNLITSGVMVLYLFLIKSVISVYSQLLCC